MLAESQQAVQLAMTAGAGDLATASLLLVRRVAQRRMHAPSAAAAEAPADRIDLGGISWESFSQLLAWAWGHLGYEVEITGVGPSGFVDFILTDSDGYTYVQARRWRQPEVTANDIERLSMDMTLVGVERGVWMALGTFTSRARLCAERSGIRLVESEELATMVDWIRSGEARALTQESPPGSLN